MKKEHKIFFAIPFDNLTKKTYEGICEDIKKYFNKDGYKLTTVIGKEQIGPSLEYSEILSFRAQNTELQKQFFKEIAEADVIVADLTNNNPNVHVELGVALTLNKNILRVTGRPEKELGFDIQNLEVYLYKSEKGLFEKIVKYLELFFKIKKLDFSEEYKSLYKKIPEIVMLPGTEAEIAKEKLWVYPIKEYTFRDGAIKLEFEFVNNLNSDSWFGVYFRTAREIYLGSYLLYIRKNGFVELAEYNPNLNIVYKKQHLKELVGKTNLQIEIENDEVEAKINGQNCKITRLEQQIKGRIIIATYECRAQFRALELINRDTIEL